MASIWGNARNNYLYGTRERDSINGDLGNDYLRGYAGDDLLTGGAGADRFVFERTRDANGKDTITDFKWGEDILDFSLVGFARGVFNRAASLSDVIRIKQGPNGARLLIDVDGGGNSFQEWAVLQNVTTLGSNVGLRVGAYTYTASVSSHPPVVTSFTVSGINQLSVKADDAVTARLYAWTGGTVGSALGFTSTPSPLVAYEPGIFTLTAQEDRVTEAVLRISDGVNTVAPGADTHVFLGTNGAESINGSGAADMIFGFGNDDTIDADAGDDTVQGGDGNDNITGGEGADDLSGDNGDDTFFFATQAELAEDTAIDGGAGTDTIEVLGTTLRSADFARVAGMEQLFFSGTDDHSITLGAETNAAFATGITITSNLTAKSLTVNGAASTVVVNATGTENADILTGGTAGDSLVGSVGNDTLTGGAGADLLEGGTGNNTYVFNTGDVVAGETVTLNTTFGATETFRVDTSTDFAALNAGAPLAGLDVINIASGQTATFNGAQLHRLALAVNGVAAGLTETLQVNGTNDTATPDSIDLWGMTANNALVEINLGDGGDSLESPHGKTVITGGAGADWLFLYDGDHLVTDAGIGADTIKANSGTGVKITVQVTGADLVKVEGAGDGTTVNVNNAINGRVDVIADDQDDFATVNGGNGNDTIRVINSSYIAPGVTINGGAGDDTITSESGTGAQGAHIIDGGAGTDYMDFTAGGDGNQVFLISEAAHHTIDETIIGGQGTDEIRFTTTTDGETLVLSKFVAADVEKARISNAAGNMNGTVAASINATKALGAIDLFGNDGDNTLTGNDLSNILMSWAGNDTLIGNGGIDYITGGAGADSLDGGAGADVLVFASAAELLGDATVIGGDDSDTIRIDSGVDPLALVSTDFASVIGVETLALNGTGTQAVTLGAETNTAFANGITITTQATAASLNLAGALSTVSINATGTNNNDTLVGGTVTDTLVGGTGNDSITGGAGADSLDGGAGDDVFIIAAAADHAAGETITGGTENDVIRFTSTAAGTLVLTANVSVEEARITDANGDATGTTAESIDARNAQGTIALYGNAGNNQLTGNAVANTIVGGAGNDTITGGAGADNMDGGTGDNVFVFNTGDVVSGETVAFNGVTDTFRVESTTDFSLLNGGASFLTGLDTIALQNTNATFMANQLWQLTAAVTGTAGDPVDTLFVNGTAGMDAIELQNLTVTNAQVSVDGGAGNDAISWDESTGAVTINGGDGDDMIEHDGAGILEKADILNGGNGNDTIYGGDGNDTITGGAGVDQLSGGAGADRFSLTGVNSAADRDIIMDFKSSDLDRVGLDVDYTVVTTAANGTAAFSRHDFSDTNVGNTPATDYRMNVAGNAHDVIELRGLDQDRGNLAGATDGAELLKMFYTASTQTIGSLQFSTDVGVYLVAYDTDVNGTKGYVYLASGDLFVQAGDIKLVGTFNGVSAFNAVDFVMVQ